jgi:hypothetical protein
MDGLLIMATHLIGVMILFIIIHGPMGMDGADLTDIGAAMEWDTIMVSMMVIITEVVVTGGITLPTNVQTPTTDIEAATVVGQLFLRDQHVATKLSKIKILHTAPTEV